MGNKNVGTGKGKMRIGIREGERESREKGGLEKKSKCLFEREKEYSTWGGKPERKKTLFGQTRPNRSSSKPVPSFLGRGKHGGRKRKKKTPFF